jgi:lipoyl(octanoyl) transferase
MKLTAIDCGVMPYDEAHTLQLKVLERVQNGDCEDVLLLVEHPPVITKGRNANDQNILFSDDYLKDQGIEIREIERGGDATYHGPGQLVGYPIFDLKARHGRSIRHFVENLESVFINVLWKHYSIQAQRNDVNAGVWIEDAKIVAIGLAVKRGVTYHGFAFNVSTDLEHYQYIVPCGLVGKRVTKLDEHYLGFTNMVEVKHQVVEEFKKCYGFDEMAVISLKELDKFLDKK